MKSCWAAIFAVLHSGTAVHGTRVLRFVMTFKYVLAAMWLLGVCTVGFVANVTSIAGWTILAGLALLPPAMLWFWRDRRPHASERIQPALR